jgi:hypothetical protein
MTADVYLMDLRWIPSDKGEIYLTATYSQTDAEFDSLMPTFAADVPVELFPDGLPGEGADPTAPVRFADYQGLSEIHDYSRLDFSELRATLGARFNLTEAIGLIGEISHFDVEDDAPYLQDVTGTVSLIYGGVSWTF